MVWIRTQNKKVLMPLNQRLEIYEEDFSNNYKISLVEFGNDYFLGTYKTKQRCLEVLDEIEKAIYDSNYVLLSGSYSGTSYPQQVTYHMPKE